MKNVDFLPQRYVDRLIRRQHSRRNLLWALVILAALGLLYGTNASRIRSASATLAGYQEEQLLQEQIRSRMNTLQIRRTELQGQLELISRIDDHAPVDLVMAELSSHLSDSMAIRSLELERIRNEVKHLAEQDKEKTPNDGPVVTRVHLEGVAPNDVDIGMFYGKLTSSPLFDEVVLHFTQEIVEANRVMRVFEVSFQVVAVSVAAEDVQEMKRG